VSNATDFARLRRQWGENIRDVRKAAGLTQTQLGRLCYASQSAVARWEGGTGGIPDQHKMEIARALAVSADELFPLSLVEAWEAACNELLIDDEGRAHGRHVPLAQAAHPPSRPGLKATLVEQLERGGVLDGRRVVLGRAW